MKKKFRIAVEGATTDGRNISAAWITQMAKNYNPAVYGARVNLEHFRGVLPDGPFKAYGDVVALSAETIQDGSALDGKLALYAELDPTPELIELSKKRQKVYTSMEVNPDFGDSKEAYLQGLAITDSPASLGTQMLKFASGQPDNPLAGRKQSPGNLFSEAVEIDLSGLATEPGESSDPADPSAPQDNSPGLFARVKELLGGLSNKFASSDARMEDAHQAIELLASHQQSLLLQISQLTTQAGRFSDEFRALQASHETLHAECQALIGALDTQPASHYRARPPATGGNGAVLTDC